MGEISPNLVTLVVTQDTHVDFCGGLKSSPYAF